MLVHGGPGASHDYLLPYLLPLYIEKVTDFLQDKM
jgi:hypothetical protein